MIDYNSKKDVSALIRQKKDEIRRLDNLATVYVMEGREEHVLDCRERILRNQGNIEHLEAILESIKRKEHEKVLFT